MDALKETETRRAYYKVRYRTGLFNKLIKFKPGSEQIIECLRVLVESLSQHKKPRNRHPEPTGECTITNNNYYRQPSGPMETHPTSHPNDWREDSHLVPPPAARPLRPALVTPNSGTSRGGAINTPNSTDNTNEDVVVARRQMDRFSHLRPCLRKQCQFHTEDRLTYCQGCHSSHGALSWQKLQHGVRNRKT